MIFVQLTGGLGNQMFQYAAGYALARRRGTALRLDTRHYGRLSPDGPPRPYQLWRFDLGGRPMNRRDALRLKIGLRRAEGTGPWAAARRVVPPRFRVWHDAERGYDPALATAGRGGFLIGLWQSERYFADARDDLRRQFAFKDPPDAANQAVLAKIGAGPSVCVHVRRGDYLAAGTATRPASLDYYAAAFDRMAAGVPGANYFVFSDDPDWVRANLRVPAGSTFVTHNVGVADAEDLRLMSRCAHFVVANSTFSWWGAWLGGTPGKRVVAPRQWYAAPHASEADLVPPEWERL